MSNLTPANGGFDFSGGYPESGQGEAQALQDEDFFASDEDSGDGDEDEDLDWADINGHIGLDLPPQWGPPVEFHVPEPLSGTALAQVGIQPDEANILNIVTNISPPKRGLDDDDDPQDLRKRRRVGDYVKLDEGKDTVLFKDRDFFSKLSQYPELVMELATHLTVKSLLSLYCISKDFHAILNGHMSHAMKYCAATRYPETSRVFVFGLYDDLCMTDPVGRPHPLIPYQVRRVPSLRWLAMIRHRDQVVRDILTYMAREDHRMPRSMSLTLKKMWLTMDIATSAQRAQLMHNDKYWTDADIYNVCMFLIKLDMRFNDPIDGPGDDSMKKLFMGQRGLTPLRDLLRRSRFTTIIEMVQLSARYAHEIADHHLGMSLFGIPPEEIGIGHLEGWGRGKVHLFRMDELIPREAVRRRLDLDNHMMSMMLWGYVDPVTKKNIVVNEEEKETWDEDDIELPVEEMARVTVDVKRKGKEIARHDDGGVDDKMEEDESEDEDEDEEDDEDEDEEMEGRYSSGAMSYAEQWSTDDEDMAAYGVLNDPNDAAAGGASGWRNPKPGIKLER